MKRVGIDDVVGLSRYEEIRDQFRRKIIELKKRRRVGVGDNVTFVFENFDTVLFQVQEMIRAEHIVDLDAVRHEIDTYNELLPATGELSATMLIELDDSATVKEELPKFYGIDRAVRLEVGDRKVAAVFEGGRSREDLGEAADRLSGGDPSPRPVYKVSAVQYVRFPLGESAAALLAGAPVRIVIDHPNYRASTDLAPDVREALAADLRD